MEIRYSGARFGGYHFEYVGIRVWLQTPPSGLVLALALAWIFAQIFVFTGRWDARPRRSVERKLAGQCHRRPLAFGAVATTSVALRRFREGQQPGKLKEAARPRFVDEI